MTPLYETSNVTPLSRPRFCPYQIFILRHRHPLAPPAALKAQRDGTGECWRNPWQFSDNEELRYIASDPDLYYVHLGSRPSCRKDAGVSFIVYNTFQWNLGEVEVNYFISFPKLDLIIMCY